MAPAFWLSFWLHVQIGGPILSDSTEAVWLRGSKCQTPKFYDIQHSRVSCHIFQGSHFRLKVPLVLRVDPLPGLRLESSELRHGPWSSCGRTLWRPICFSHAGRRPSSMSIILGLTWWRNFGRKCVRHVKGHKASKGAFNMPCMMFLAKARACAILQGKLQTSSNHSP